jgi:hypothetical protein
MCRGPAIGRLLSCIVLSDVLMHLLSLDAAKARAPLPPRTHTYRFTARITDNAGITPFKVGELITGTFSYDPRGKNLRPDVVGLGRYQSTRNSLVFQFGGLRFSGLGDISASVSTLDHAEDFGVVAPDLELPMGWEMDHTGRSQSYGLILQNAPPRNAIRSIALPDRLSLSDFVDTRELRLDFFHGVRFPGGQVNARATLSATVERLEQVGR